MLPPFYCWHSNVWELSLKNTKSVRAAHYQFSDWWRHERNLCHGHRSVWVFIEIFAIHSLLLCTDCYSMKWLSYCDHIKHGRILVPRQSLTSDRHDSATTISTQEVYHWHLKYHHLMKRTSRSSRTSQQQHQTLPSPAIEVVKPQKRADLESRKYEQHDRTSEPNEETISSQKRLKQKMPQNGWANTLRQHNGLVHGYHLWHCCHFFPRLACNSSNSRFYKKYLTINRQISVHHPPTTCSMTTQPTTHSKGVKQITGAD